MNTYLETISKNIKNKTAEKEVLAEIEAHIEEKKEYYIEIGYCEEEAEAKAIEEMGDAEETAVSLNGLYSQRWYKLPLNIFTIVFCLLSLAYIFLALPKLPYFLVYDYAYENHNFLHSIIVDFISSVIFSVNIYLLYFSYKRKNKNIALIIGSVFLFILISSFFIPSSRAIFEPMFFGIITIFTKGPYEYVRSVFGRGIVNNNLYFIYSLLSLIVILLIIFTSVLSFIATYRKERMLNTRKAGKVLNKIYFLGKSFGILILIISLLFLMIAVFTLPVQLEEDKAMRKRMIEFISEEDVSKGKEAVIRDMESEGFIGEENNDGSYSFNYNYAELYFYNNDYTYFQYQVIPTWIPSPLNNNSPFITDDNIVDILGKYQKNKTTLNDFLKDDLFLHADFVSTDEKKRKKRIRFCF